ncbi:MAG TPA: hypothetical protein DCM14_05065 [Clostridiales bacterium UBA8153]|nr:hypothetical protein [Clostridiales bacterium UBA8153]
MGAMAGLLLTGFLLTVARASAGTMAQVEHAPILSRVRVASVSDGDTFRAHVGRRLESIRLIGVDAPEVGPGEEPHGREALEFARRTLLQKTVWLEFDVRQRDTFGRLLAYVWLEPPDRRDPAATGMQMFNARLLVEGYGQVMTVPPNVRYAEWFVRWQEQARAARRGLWAAEESAAGAAPHHRGETMVVIASVDLRAEAVVIANRGNAPVDLSGWILVSERGNQRFVFPAGTSLPAGGSLRVVSGPPAASGPGRLLWTRSHIWNNAGDPAVLLTPAGVRVSRR